MNKYFALLGSFMLASGIVLSLAAPARAAETGTTSTFNWATTADPTKELPTNASNVPWPQKLINVGDLPKCLTVATVVQSDVYLDDSEADAALIAKLIKQGTLNLIDGTPEDSTIVVSWKFVLVPACEVVVVTPTPSETEDVVVPSPAVPAPVAVVESPVVPPAVKTTPVAVPAPVQVVSAPQKAPDTLANTGFISKTLLFFGIVILLAGAGLVLLGRKSKH